MYSPELKNAVQIARPLANAARGDELVDGAESANRYRNTLRNMGFWERPDQEFEENDATRSIEALRAGGDSKEFWRQNSRAVDKASFDYQISRLDGGRGEAVSTMWKEVFFNVQELCDHLPRGILDAALLEESLTEILALQLMNAVGTEAWRYGRMNEDERLTARSLLVRIRKLAEPADLLPDTPVLQAAYYYGKAGSAFQVDVRLRVAGFIEAYLVTKDRMGYEFPRIGPDLSVTRASGLGGAPGRTRGLPPPMGADRLVQPLDLPRQLIISGCPGSGKSHYAESKLVQGTEVVRTQFHAETSAASFIGSYRPVPVYEPMVGVQSLDGVPFGKGRPIIDYQFVPGPALLAISFALRHPERNVVLLIEELNRGNAAAAFGELFQLLDRQESGPSRYAMALPAEAAAWLVEQGALQVGAELRLPANLYLWATMNSGDQGVFPIDTAFRRRWSFRYLGYAEPCLYEPASRSLKLGGVNVDWDKLRECINRKLKQLGINEDRLIGPYFLTREQLADSGEVLSKLLLYLWDDVLRFRQSELFRQESFSEVGKVWKDGTGNPFLEGIVDPLQIRAEEVVVGTDEAAEVDETEDDIEAEEEVQPVDETPD